MSNCHLNPTFGMSHQLWHRSVHPPLWVVLSEERRLLASKEDTKSMNENTPCIEAKIGPALKHFDGFLNFAP